MIYFYYVLKYFPLLLNYYLKNYLPVIRSVFRSFYKIKIVLALLLCLVTPMWTPNCHAKYIQDFLMLAIMEKGWLALLKTDSQMSASEG